MPERVAALVARLPALTIAAFAFWALVGLGQTRITLDEIPVIDPTISLLERGYMSIPSAGPGREHEAANLYQTPLEFLLLAGVFRATGVGLLQGRALTLALAVVVLMLIVRIMRRHGPLASTIAVAVLAVDPLFSSRARQIRYDMPALIGALLAFLLLSEWRPSERPASSTPRYGPPIAAGLALGFAVMAHAEYLILLPMLTLLTLIMPADAAMPFKERVRGMLLFTTAATVVCVPFGVYALDHPVAFQEQFLRIAGWHGHASESPATWLLGEAWKYAYYYLDRRPTPLLLLLSVVSTAIVIVELAADGASERRSLARLAALAIALPLIVGAITRHIYWHHLMVAPFWAMTCGVAATSILTRGRRVRAAGALLLAAALVNGLIVSWGLTTYSAVRGWGSRHVETVESEIVRWVPDGSRVYAADYRLYFIARRHHWAFAVGYDGMPYVDGDALRRARFDYVITSSFEPSTDDAALPFDLTTYRLIATVEHQPKALLPPPWPTTQFRIYARRPDEAEGLTPAVVRARDLR